MPVYGEEITTMNIEVYTSLSEDDTSRLGTEFSERLVPGETVALYGDLGAGKTEFIKGICDGLEVEEIVSSPTYTIVNQYSGVDRRGRPVVLYHVDLYRVEQQSELREIGLEELLADPGAIKLIEWAEHAGVLLPAARYDVRVTSLDDENSRKIEVIRHGELELVGGGNGVTATYGVRRNSPRSPLG